VSDDLESIAPGTAIELYLDHREPEVSEKTLQNQRYRLNSFVEWCHENEIENLNTISGRDLHEYRTWRSEHIKKITLVNELRTLQKFLEFLASIDAVEEGMRERVLIPKLERGDEAKDIELHGDRAKKILSHLERFSYASRDHVIASIIWHTGIRIGTLRALDVDDFDPETKCLDLRHRPETGTPLKNGDSAERSINISDRYCEIIQDYITHHRHDVVDDHGRRPLITSEYGRLSATPIRRTCNELSQPCLVGECPHEKDPKTCEFKHWSNLANCPSARSPHAWRRGSITHHLREKTPQQIVEERCDVSGDVLEQHYDERTEREKAEARREWLEGVFRNNGS
jgi:site-specific recombinase XerD